MAKRALLIPILQEAVIELLMGHPSRLKFEGFMHIWDGMEVIPLRIIAD